MFVIEDVSQLFISWEKASHPFNMTEMLVIFEISHEFMDGTVVKEEHPLKKPDNVVTPVKSGASVAVIVKLEHP